MTSTQCAYVFPDGTRCVLDAGHEEFYLYWWTRFGESRKEMPHSPSTAATRALKTRLETAETALEGLYLDLAGQTYNSHRDSCKSWKLPGIFDQHAVLKPGIIAKACTCRRSFRTANAYFAAHVPEASDA